MLRGKSQVPFGLGAFGVRLFRSWCQTLSDTVRVWKEYKYEYSFIQEEAVSEFFHHLRSTEVDISTSHRYPWIQIYRVATVQIKGLPPKLGANYRSSSLFET